MLNRYEGGSTIFGILGFGLILKPFLFQLSSHGGFLRGHGALLRGYVDRMLTSVCNPMSRPGRVFPGPHQLNGYIQELTTLARSLGNGTKPGPGPTPQDFV